MGVGGCVRVGVGVAVGFGVDEAVAVRVGVLDGKRLVGEGLRAVSDAEMTTGGNGLNSVADGEGDGIVGERTPELVGYAASGPEGNWDNRPRLVKTRAARAMTATIGRMYR